MPSGIEQLAYELLPHSPAIGLYVAPDIPERLLDNALGDYAKAVAGDEALALYDATLTGNAKDGAVFTADRFVYQNSDLSPAQEIRYDDIVGVKSKRKLLMGKKVHVDVNRGRATVTSVVDFSGKPDAADHVARFLYEAMMYSIEVGAGETDVAQAARWQAAPEPGLGETDVAAVREALEGLVTRGRLSPRDRDAMLRALEE